ncbi:hypothetical protein DL93DRAFT_2162030 [Clavulina sp. PMI_390]|nr:hypothetical protein DL93DRAFT_2162030 [Clavulina sp. PMI_390]
MANGGAASSGAESSYRRKRPVTVTPTRETRSKRARTRGTEAELTTSRTTRPKPRRNRSVKGKEKALTSDEEDDEDADTLASNTRDHDAEVVDAQLASNSLSPTSSSSGSSPAGGKSSPATSLDDVEATLALTQKELDSKNELLKKQSATIQTLQSVLQCSICLDLLWSPYSLTPCGHVACENCLVQWFSQPSEAEEQLELPLLAQFKKKTCPTCRTEVRSRPTVAYLVKSALDAVLPCLDPSSYEKRPPSANLNHDPFKELFPAELDANERRRRNGILDAHPGVIIDDEDGGVPRCPDCIHEIFDGVCTGCGRLYDGVEEDDPLDDDDGRLHDAVLFGGNGGFWDYSDDEDDEPYESDFIDDGPEQRYDYSDDEVDEAYLEPRARRDVPGPSRLRQSTIIIESDEESAEGDGGGWRSYLGRTVRRHDIEPVSEDDDAPRASGSGAGASAAGPSTATRQGGHVRRVESDDDRVVPDPRNAQGANQGRSSRTRRRRGGEIIIVSDDDGRAHPNGGRVPDYTVVSENEDVRPPWAAARRRHLPHTRRVVHLDSDNDEEDEEENSDEDDAFEDAASDIGSQSSTGASGPHSRSHSRRHRQASRSRSRRRVHSLSPEAESGSEVEEIIRPHRSAPVRGIRRRIIDDGVNAPRYWVEHATTDEDNDDDEEEEDDDDDDDSRMHYDDRSGSDEDEDSHSDGTEDSI